MSRRAGTRSEGPRGGQVVDGNVLDDGGDSTADRLLRIAAKLFRKQGYAATTTRELSDELGIQKASLYHHIRGKEDLLYQISVESLRRISETVTEAGREAPSEERLRAMIIAHVLSALDNQDMHQTMLIDMRSLSSVRQQEIRDRRDEYERLLVDAVRADQGAGRLRVDYDAHTLTLALLNLLNWTIFWYDSAGKRSALQIAEMLAAMFLDGARVRGS